MKERLGFKGLITTDSLTMAAIWKKFTIEEIVLHGINAGNDVLVFCGPAEISMQLEVISAFKKLVSERKISMDRINESVEKILKLKEKYARVGNEEIVINNTSKTVVRKSITKVKDNNLLPLKKTEKVLILFPKIHLASLVDNENNTYETLKKHLGYEEIIFNQEKVDVSDIVAKQHNYDKIIMATYNVQKDDVQEKLYKQLDSNKTIVVALRSPYDILILGDVKTYICTYDVTKESIEALSDALLSNEFLGKLPVNLNEVKK